MILGGNQLEQGFGNAMPMCLRIYDEKHAWSREKCQFTASLYPTASSLLLEVQLREIPEIFRSKGSAHTDDLQGYGTSFRSCL